MFGWLRKKKKSKSLNIKISATQISDSKRRDIDTALEWLNDLLDNDGFEVAGDSREDNATIEKSVDVEGGYDLDCRIDLGIIDEDRQNDDHRYVSGIEFGSDLSFQSWDGEIEFSEGDNPMTYKKCRSTYEKFMQKVEKTGLLEPKPGPE